MRHACINLVVLFICGCVSNAERIDDQARAAGLSRHVLAGEGFRHLVYSRDMAQSTVQSAPDRVVIFIDGDGRPWSADGQQPAADPTTRNPVALELLTKTPVSAAYVSRPCYQDIVDALCSPAVWTSARYSDAVVRSMAAAIRHIRQQASAAEIVLIGYSGGGVLAVLVAERLENVAAVITIAANLDTEAWTQHHGYLPLADSLNPARSEHDHRWREIHLQGLVDAVVPPATTDAYFERYPTARRERFAEYDHVCCWARQWPSLFEQISGAVGTDHGE